MSTLDRRLTQMKDDLTQQRIRQMSDEALIHVLNSWDDLTDEEIIDAIWGDWRPTDDPEHSSL